VFVFFSSVFCYARERRESGDPVVFSLRQNVEELPRSGFGVFKSLPGVTSWEISPRRLALDRRSKSVSWSFLTFPLYFFDSQPPPSLVYLLLLPSSFLFPSVNLLRSMSKTFPHQCIAAFGLQVYPYLCRSGSIFCA
jgi:hypothetical protein